MFSSVFLFVHPGDDWRIDRDEHDLLNPEPYATEVCSTYLDDGCRFGESWLHPWTTLLSNMWGKLTGFGVRDRGNKFGTLVVTRQRDFIT